MSATNEAIKELSTKLTYAENELDRLQEERDKLITKQYHLDYTVANQQKRIEDLGKTLELYERENRAMKELLRIWI